MKPWFLFLSGLVACNHVVAKQYNDSEHPTHSEVRLAPGDDKTFYERSSYKTNSLSLAKRTGHPAALDVIARTPQLGLPERSGQQIQAIDKRKIALGRKLFFDRRLSRNKTMSCAMCHIPEQGFSSNELARPIGFEGRGLKRNAPTILNVAFAKTLFWDARENNLAQQVWSPLLAANEMNNASVGAVIDVIEKDAEYRNLFKNAFGASPNMLNIGEAIARLVSANSRFDQWHFGKADNKLTADEIAGYQLFIGKASCSTCHTINQRYALFTDHKLHNTGLGYFNSMSPAQETITVQLAPGVTTEREQSVIQSVSEDKPNDLGRYEVSNQPIDRWKFKTPSLRNVALTAPYMHDGSLNSLREVVSFYNKGGVKNELLSPLIRPLNLNVQEQTSLVSFLKTLTGDNVAALVSDGFAAPIGDTNDDSKSDNSTEE